MADRGQWVKLWCSAEDDPDLSALSLEDFGRWCKLLIYVKRHGTDGRVVFKKNANILREKFRCKSDDEVVSVLASFPNVTVQEKQNETFPNVTALIVTFCNWNIYQGDNSAERTRLWRERVTIQEEKRREEKKKKKRKEIPPSAPQGSDGLFEKFWQAYPRKESKPKAAESFGRLQPTEALLAKIIGSIEQRRLSHDWTKDGGKYIPHPSTFLNQRRWEDEVTNVKPKTPGQRTADNLRLLGEDS